MKRFSIRLATLALAVVSALTFSLAGCNDGGDDDGGSGSGSSSQ